MDIKYYLNGSDKNLYCQINDENAKTNFSIGYEVDPKLWDSMKGEVHSTDSYFYTLKDFKSYLSQKYIELKIEREGEVLNILKEEALDLLKNSGLEGVSRKIFNLISDKHGLPKYDGYLFAFEKFTGLKSKNYRVEILDYHLHFHTNKGIFEIDTYEGKITLLKKLIKNRAYIDIVELSDSDIWNEIYEDIPKCEFIPTMRNEIEYCLKENFERTGIYIGSNEIFEEKQSKLYKQFQIFIDRYEEGNVIDLVWEIHEEVLYPIAVITMTKIFDLNACCKEYCELEFNNEKENWKAVFIDDELEEEDNNAHVFYIKPYA
ncbi:MAG: hypothetical protein K0R36_891 [Chryseobacterium sp.]|jgi:hypothetical protein|nr:hypothetical protein [Chryseobacterium sp.]